MPLRDNDGMIPLDEAHRRLDAVLAEIRLETEILPLRDALGRVLGSDQVSRLALPPFDKSAMDGYAVLPDDIRDEYQLLETIPAGSVGTKKLEQGTVIKVMTGAAVPEGSGRVIIVEHTEESGDRVRVHRHDTAGNIARHGEDLQPGDPVLKAGTRLTSLDIANLISCGITEVEVARPVRVEVFSTGDEIVDHPDQLAPGRIMNSNGPLLAGLAREHGLVVTGESILPDDRAATEKGIAAALERADMVILSGGVSLGDFDFVSDVLEKLGLTTHFNRLAVKPGKPTVFASDGQRLVFALPGNPVSAYVMFHLFVLRGVARISGANQHLRELQLPLQDDFRRRGAKRAEFIPARLTADCRLESISYHGSAHLSALTRADGFFLVPLGVKEITAGENVLFTTFGRELR